MNGLDLQKIAASITTLHDDAYNPTRAIARQPIEENVWTKPHLEANARVTTHPHLRTASGATTTPIPHGDHDARSTYHRAVRTITTAYNDLVPTGARQRPRGPVDGTARPTDLLGMLAQLHQVLLRSNDDHDPNVDRHGRHLARLADDLTGWRTTWTPPEDYRLCPNPHERRRCTGHPQVGIHCRSCYDHQRYLERTAHQEAS